MGFIEFKIDYLPPLKDGAFSILNPKHRIHDRVEYLQNHAKIKMINKKKFKGNLGILVENYGCRGDSDNIIGGIFDSLENIIFENDNQFIEVNYRFLTNENNFYYKIKIWEIK